METKIEWIKVNEDRTNIPINVKLLVTDGDVIITGVVENSKYNFFFPIGINRYEWDCDIDFRNITFFSLLPEPPKE